VIASETARGLGGEGARKMRHGDAATRRHGETRGHDGLLRGIVGWVVKDQGGKKLTGVGIGGGAENWRGFGRGAHYIDGRGDRGRLCGGHVGGLGGCLARLSLRLGPALLLRGFQILHGGAEGTLQLRALFDHEGELARIFFIEFNIQIFLNVQLFVDSSFAAGDTGEQPLRSGRSFEIQPFGRGFRMPLVHELAPEVVVLLGFFVAEDEGARAQAVSEGVEAYGGLALRSFWTRRLLGVFAVCLVLFV